MSGQPNSNPARVAWLIVASLVAFVALFAAGCGGDDNGGGGGGNELTKVGKPEGKLNLIAWVGYV